ncbi:3-oxoadipyl-CoA thiolase [Chryseolinea serpens]|uniref:3-oxoadipyl-CoA thiolase n=1 Tax=Chryseolinea serpens TaxID=947013 RepID=A0A1M5TDD0_9BACT|nr:acetyl-CoA C-acyltransferase [Chryseolinea serpens]SHH48728.1 3-oxoadipyl-CoA thiolase [Chryseolinea serpens]
MNAFIIDGIRTPIGNLGGSLSSVRTDDLAALVIKELLKRNPDVPASAIDEVIFGCVNQAGDDNRNVARMALLLAGLPHSVPGETVNRLCASGMSAVVNAARAINNNDGDIYLAGGVENMTRGPYVISKSAKPYGGDAQMFDSSFGWRFVNPLMESMYGVDPMGVTAEKVAELYGVSRDDQDLFAFRSQKKANVSSERLAAEIVPVKFIGKKGEVTVFDSDEFRKPGTTIEALSKLRPAFKKEAGTVTAGNSSGLNDGAVAILIASERALEKYNLRPLAKIVANSAMGVKPEIMGIGPVDATRKVLAKSKLTLDEIGVIELNEAFAAQCLACIRELGLSDDDPRININGGAIALGHPLGMTGARIILSAAMELQRRNERYALATMCVGVGQGSAVVLERV